MDILTELSPLLPAEKQLLAEAENTSLITFGDGELPTVEAPDIVVRAALIRALLLDEVPNVRLDKKGVRLRGAWISDRLDLQGLDCTRDINLRCCRLDAPLELASASLRGLSIFNCSTERIFAGNTQFSGSVYIRGDTHISDEVDLSGARISGNLQICGVKIDSSTEHAIFAPSLQVDGSVFLGNYPYTRGESTHLICGGQLFFSSARVADDFFISNVAINIPDPEQTLQDGSQNEEQGDGIALSLVRANVKGMLFLQSNEITHGTVNLAGARVVLFKDEPTGPGANFPIRLDGFQYSDFSRQADTSIQARLDWLERRPKNTPFTPQPYEQLAFVLKRIGHRGNARRVLMEKERNIRKYDKKEALNHPKWYLKYPATVAGDWFLKITIGYGYRPARAVSWAILLILTLGVFFQKTWDAGDMAPNAAPILVSKNWVDATLTHPNNPAAFWARPDQAGQDYETFNAYAYAADLVVPIVSLGQEAAWAPSTSRSPLGRIGWWVRWFAIAIGWIVTALGAAAITGVIRND